ncbi:MAG TPA: acyl-CoA dehydrogenase family protein, partial [Anaerolineae bacterium]|nr:acyl-CoA dehydrogenase family protein [Anaerolineae bacterium]
MNFDLNEEQRMWRQTVHDFCEQEVKPLAAELDETEEVNLKAIEKMGPLGMLGMAIEEEYGGSGVDNICAAIAIEELGWADGGVAL